LSQLQQQQQLLKRDMPISQILRTHGKQFTQIQLRYSDGHNGRCVIGLIMSYFGWNGKNSPGSAQRLLAAFVSLKNEGIDEEILMDLNDSGYTFDEIADHLDRVDNLAE
jgi:hypothetical protein